MAALPPASALQGKQEARERAWLMGPILVMLANCSYMMRIVNWPRLILSMSSGWSSSGTASCYAGLIGFRLISGTGNELILSMSSSWSSSGTVSCFTN